MRPLSGAGEARPSAYPFEEADQRYGREASLDDVVEAVCRACPTRALVEQRGAPNETLAALRSFRARPGLQRPREESSGYVSSITLPSPYRV